MNPVLKSQLLNNVFTRSVDHGLSPDPNSQSPSSSPRAPLISHLPPFFQNSENCDICHYRRKKKRFMQVFSDMILEDKYFNDFYFYFAKPINQIIYNDKDEVVTQYKELLYEFKDSLSIKYYPKDSYNDSNPNNKKCSKTYTTTDSSLLNTTSNDILKIYISRNFYGSKTPNDIKPNLCLVKPYDVLMLNKKYWEKRHKRVNESKILKKNLAEDPTHFPIKNL
jgi:hypothetical protein